MVSSRSLRARLVVSFVAIVVGVLLVAASFGIVRFDALMTEQAQRAVETNMSVASGLLNDAVTSVAEAVTETAGDMSLPDGRAETRVALMGELGRRAQLTELTYFAVVEPDGTVRVTSLDSPEYTTGWDVLRVVAASGETTAGLALVPESELESVGLARRLTVGQKETPNGTIVTGEAEGALAIVATAPFRGGTLVAVRALKRDFGLVDSIVDKVGGTATVFQGGTRVSTTVLNDAGERAIGTVVSDAVRETTLVGGEAFRGEAFVVNKTYLTAYEPLRASDGRPLGILYVGIEQAPYAAATRAFGLTFVAVILLALALAVFGAFNVSRALTRPLTGLSGAAASVATGDLTTRVPSEGYRESRDLGDAFNTMTDGLRQIITQVEASVMQLRSVAGEITAASRSSAEHAVHQASSVAQTTATLEELTASFRSVAEGARHVLDIAENALESAQGGMETVDRAHSAMDELSGGARQMAEAAAAMTAVTEDIHEMTGIITGIAEQTKILALNAAIEAARAGEAGKGFAVVSSEIRALADSVARSAGRITELIGGIQSAGARLQDAAAQQASLTDVTLGSSAESRDVFGAIVRQMEDTAEAAREIAEATVQQNRASEQLVEAMHQVSVSTNETAAAAKQLADAADSVESEADGLLGGLTRFRTR